MKFIKQVRIITNGKISHDCYDVETDNGLIKQIRLSAHGNADNDRYLTGGYIDIHTHGALGKDCFEATQEALDKHSSYLLSQGVTGFCPSFVAASIPTLKEKLTNYRSLKFNYSRGYGVHLEGPFISFAKKGAQPAESIKTVFEEGDGEFFEDFASDIGIVTMCPATKNAPKLVQLLAENGIRVQGGHDDSIEQQIYACLDKGMSGVTHIYCACSNFRRIKGDITKYLGMTEIGLFDDRMTVEVIADGVHVSPTLFKWIYKCKGYEKVCLISDSLSATGCPNGIYTIGDGVEVRTDDRAAFLNDGGNTLAGSITNVAQMVRNVMSYGVPMAQAVYMANQSPSNYLGLNNVGAVEVGAQADLIILDGKANVIETIVG